MGLALTASLLAGCSYPAQCKTGDYVCSLPTLLLFVRHKAARFVYFTDQGGNTIFVARIQPAGHVETPASAATLTAANTLEIDAAGKTLVASGNGGLNFYSINDQTGALTFQGIDTQIGAPLSVAFDPHGRFVAATENTSGHMLCSLNGRGGFGSCVKDATNYQLRDIVVSAGPALYGATDATPSVMRSFSINPDTLTTAVLGSNMSTGGSINTPSGMIMNANGTRIHTAFTAGSPNGPYVTTVINSDGTIASNTAAALVNGFIAGGFDPQQTMVFLNQASNSLIMGIPVNSDGTLSNSPSLLRNVGGGPGRIRVDPQGRFVYVANNPEINVLTIDATALSPLSNVAASPTGWGMSLASYYEYP